MSPTREHDQAILRSAEDAGHRFCIIRDCKAASAKRATVWRGQSLNMNARAFAAMDNSATVYELAAPGEWREVRP